ncbi:MAG TPA: sensor histidine kinase N-terminal domain-containing protein [Burkholderiales bacterium]|nr:sensor histidine kinase N-terminal domain-containing protein [Burkholderiales bacterium]
MSRAAAAPSIRRELLARLVGPLVLIMALGGGSAYGLSHYFTQVVLDHWLYDNAISLANRVKWENGRSEIDLPEGAREILEWDTVDRLYYEVISERGERLIYNGLIAAPPMQPTPEHPVYYESIQSRNRVRALAVAVDEPGGATVIVKVAETRHKRDALATQVLWISVALSIVLAIVSAIVTWLAIGSGMASMNKAVRDIRTVHAAAPLSPIPAGADVPVEVQPLVEEINTLIHNLSRAHELNQRFIADAAHQLRTPIATLRVQLEIALREEDPERHTTAVNDAVRELARMSRTLHQLLTLARADENGKAEPSTEAPVDIDLIAREEVERRIDDAVAAGVDLGYAGAGAPVLVRGAQELLREAVANLLDNALRYGASGRHVTVGVLSGEPEVYVEDDGPGIPESERERVTQRFYRVRGSSGDGCGLGLSIVNEIVRRHAGKLVLESGANGRGLRARVRFAV